MNDLDVEVFGGSIYSLSYFHGYSFTGYFFYIFRIYTNYSKESIEKKNLRNSKNVCHIPLESNMANIFRVSHVLQLVLDEPLEEQNKGGKGNNRETGRYLSHFSGLLCNN